MKVQGISRMNKTKSSILAGVLACTVLLSACTKGGGLSSEKVATVNGTPISKAEYDKTYSEFEKAFHLESAPEQQRNYLADTLRQMTLNKLILQTLVYNEAKKAGIQVTDADVKDYKQKKIFNDPALKEQFQTFLTQNNMKESDFDAMLKDNLLLNKFMDAKGGAQVQASDAELKAYYTKNQEQFKIPERIKASHILVKAIVPQMKQELRSKSPNIKEEELDKTISAKRQELKTKADKIFAEVKANPAKFEELAKANSDDPMSAKRGGDLGYLVESNIDPAFWAAAEKTENGKLHPSVVSTQFGFHILKVLDRQPPHMQSFEEAKEGLREHLEQEKKQEFLEKWAKDQKATAKIEIEPEYEPKKASAPEGGHPAPAAQQQPAAANPEPKGKH
jgi:peptidyl-prolyl cis-trans isomerase C